MASTIRMYALIHVATSKWNRPKSKASQPPTPMPPIMSKTSQGRGFPSVLRSLAAMASIKSLRIINVDNPCMPPPSEVNSQSEHPFIPYMKQLTEREDFETLPGLYGYCHRLKFCAARSI